MRFSDNSKEIFYGLLFILSIGIVFSLLLLIGKSSFAKYLTSNNIGLTELFLMLSWYTWEMISYFAKGFYRIYFHRIYVVQVIGLKLLIKVLQKPISKADKIVHVRRKTRQPEMKKGRKKKNYND